MEKGQISKTQIGIIAAVVAVIAAIAAFLVIHFTKAEDAYRSIQIYEVEGTAAIDREGIGAIEAVENLYLESGDRVTVPAGSTMRLKLDDDKYILVEENTVLSIEAEGTKQDSLTTIKLEQGAVTNEIRNPLSKKSSYEVATPNSVMAVRGTIFRVAISNDENDILYTKVDTFEGSVGVRRILPDGSIQEEDAYVLGGNEVIIFMDEQTTEYLSEPQEIKYEELPVQTLDFLQDCIDGGREIVGASRESLEILIAEKRQQEAAENTAGDGMMENAEPTLEEETPEPEENADEPVGQMPDQNVVQGAEEAVQAIDPTQLQPVGLEEQVVTEEEQTAVQTTSTKKSSSSSGSGSDDENDEEKASYTVTFRRSDGSVFGTQTVEDGGMATEPKLKPETSGNWDFDFTEKITKDTEINWKP